MLPTDDLIQRANALDENRFVELLGAVYEHSPWVAQAAWQKRPFSSRDHLAARMEEAMQQADREKQLTLIRAHPVLGVARLERLTASSQLEQRAAGFHQMDPAEIAEFDQLNRSYAAKFGFPFILAVTGKTRRDIRLSIQERLGNCPEQEFLRCLSEIAQIARHRINAL